MPLQTDTHSTEPGHSQWDGRLEVVGTLLGQRGDEAGGCSHNALEES